MRRRSFLALLGGAAVAPVAARLPLGIDPSRIRTANPAVGVITAEQLAYGTITGRTLQAGSLCVGKLSDPLTEAQLACLSGAKVVSRILDQQLEDLGIRV